MIPMVAQRVARRLDAGPRISPAQHQLHHSIAHSHPNYGSFLAIWDRFNRTWVAGSEARGLSYGIIENRLNAGEFGGDDLRPISVP